MRLAPHNRKWFDQNLNIIWAKFWFFASKSFKFDVFLRLKLFWKIKVQQRVYSCYGLEEFLGHRDHAHRLRRPLHTKVEKNKTLKSHQNSWYSLQMTKSSNFFSKSQNFRYTDWYNSVNPPVVETCAVNTVEDLPPGEFGKKNHTKNAKIVSKFVNFASKPRNFTLFL